MKRRDFMKMSGLAAGAVLIPVRQLHAEDLPHLAEDEPQAKALGYVAQSTVQGSYCSNCTQATGDLGADWLGCNIFPGKQVKAAGWCKAWSRRAG